MVVEIGLTSFTIGRFATEIGQVVHAVHSLGHDDVQFFYSSTATDIAAGLTVGYQARERARTALNLAVLGADTLRRWRSRRVKKPAG